jgi:hypothetical protein
LYKFGTKYDPEMNFLTQDVDCSRYASSPFATTQKPTTTTTQAPSTTTDEDVWTWKWEDSDEDQFGKASNEESDKTFPRSKFFF